MARREDNGMTGDGVGRDHEAPMGGTPADGVPTQGAGGSGDASLPDIGDLLGADTFLSALASGAGGDSQSKDEAALAALLGQWRDEISSTPIPVGPSIDEVLRAMEAGNPGVPSGIPAQGAPVSELSARRNAGPARRTRWLTSVAGVAAAAAVVLGGLAVLSQNAQPGDPLWGFREQIHGADESSVMVAGLWEELIQAEQALESGDVERVERILSELAPKISAVDGAEQDELSTKFRALSEDLQRHPNRPEVAPVTTTDRERTTQPTTTLPGLPTGIPELPTVLPTLPTELPQPPVTVPPEIMSIIPWPPITELPLPVRPTTPGDGAPTETNGGEPTASGEPTTAAPTTTASSTTTTRTTTTPRPTSSRLPTTTASAPVSDEVRRSLEATASNELTTTNADEPQSRNGS